MKIPKRTYTTEFKELAIKRIKDGQKSADGTVLRMVQSDVAHAIGASRQRVSLTLQKLQKQGRIRLGYRSITLLNGSAPC